MDILDKWGRNIRIGKARKFIRQGDSVLDVGCADGALFKQLADVVGPSIGLDPLLKSEVRTGPHMLLPGSFPGDVPQESQFDALTMLAVLEHLDRTEQASLGQLSHRLLKPKGRV